MENIIKFLNDYPALKIVVIIAALFILIKIILEILKVAKVINLEDKNLFDALYSIMFKRSYLIRKAKKALRQGNHFEGGKIFEEIGDYKYAAREMEDSDWFRQTDRRARKLVSAMRSGYWESDE